MKQGNFCYLSNETISLDNMLTFLLTSVLKTSSIKSIHMVDIWYHSQNFKLIIYFKEKKMVAIIEAAHYYIPKT